MSKVVLWSKNEDDWSYAPEDKEEVLQEIWDEYEEGLQVGQTIYYGERVTPSNIFVEASDVIEKIEDQMWDQGGEWFDGALEASEEQIKELNDFLVKWQQQFTPPWFTVENIKEYTVTQDDVESIARDHLVSNYGI